jgi:hypothetical protein
VAKERKANSLDTSTCDLITTSLMVWTAPRRSQSQIAVSDDDVESYQLPSHQVELPVALVQDSIAAFESVHLEPLPESVL